MKNIRTISILLFLFVLIITSWLSPLDEPAIQQVDAGLKKALVSFASARAASGVISVLQGTQIDIMPAGIGATLAPGQVLAPINELVKHFSDLMLVASVSFGIQKVLISMSGYWVIKLILTIASFLWASYYLRKCQPPALLTKFLVVLLMLHFAVPAVTLGTDFLVEQFMASEYKESQTAIDTALGKASKINLPTPEPATPPPISAPPPANPASSTAQAPATSSWWPLHLPTVNLPSVNLPTIGLPTVSLPTIPNFAARFEEMKAAAEQATEHMVKIMAIFLLQTLVIPIFLLWALYALAKGIFQLPSRIPSIGNGKSPQT